MIANLKPSSKAKSRMGNVESTERSAGAPSSSSSSASVHVDSVGVERAREVRDLYCRLASLPMLSTGWLVKNDAEDILLQHTQADLERSTKRQFLTSFRETIGADGTKTKTVSQTSPFPIEITGVVDIAPSPSGRYLAVLRENDAAKTADNLNNKSFATIEVRLLSDEEIKRWRDGEMKR